VNQSVASHLSSYSSPSSSSPIHFEEPPFVSHCFEALRGLWLQKELLIRQLLHQPLLEGWIVYLEKISVTRIFLRALRVSDWKVRYESNRSCQENSGRGYKRIQPTGTAMGPRGQEGEQGLV
ncbi:unnamed protein product, partial [Brassica rapa subsp. trilocularis]